MQSGYWSDLPVISLSLKYALQVGLIDEIVEGNLLPAAIRFAQSYRLLVLADVAWFGMLEPLAAS